MPLNDLQLQYLGAPLNSQRVAKRSESGRTLSYLEAWDVKAHLTRIFGFGNWDSEVLDYRLLFEREYERTGNNPQTMIEVAYIARVQLTIRDKDGNQICRHSEVAAGQANVGASNASRGDAHDNAIKQAESDALKRAAINLGTQFGLSLYDDGSTADVVRWTVVSGELETVGARKDAAPNDDVPTVKTPENAEENVANTLGATKVS